MKEEVSIDLETAQQNLLKRLEHAAYTYYTEIHALNQHLGYLTGIEDACILIGIDCETVLQTKIKGQIRAGAD